VIAILELLAPTWFSAFEGPARELQICEPRHQSHASNPHHPYVFLRPILQSRNPIFRPTASSTISLNKRTTNPNPSPELAISHFLSTRPHPSPKSIIHISSIAGQLTPLHAPIYNATKHAINGFVRSLAPLDKRMNIRVTAVAPGVIKTPMWTEDREKIRFIGEADEWVSAEYVAETMVGLVEGGRMEVGGGGEGVSTGDSREELRRVDVTGGMIVEVAKGKRRVVEQFNDPGPSGEGNTVGNIGLAFEEVFEKLEGGGWGG